FFMRPKDVHIPLTVHLNTSHESVKALLEREDINGEAIQTFIEDMASHLKESEVPLTYVDEDNIQLETIVAVETEIVDKDLTEEINKINERLSGTIIEGNNVFSFLETAVSSKDKIGTSAAWD